MLTLFWVVLWLALTGLMVLAAIRLHVRHKELAASSLPQVDDDAIHEILETGELTDDDEPLDLHEIGESEERFWSESWDEPDEW
jgi:hypothetical protein